MGLNSIRRKAQTSVAGENIAWNVARKRLASCQRNRPVRVAWPGTPERSGSVWRQCKTDDETPAYRRRQTKSPETGSNASPVGRIRFLSLDDARNETLAPLRTIAAMGLLQLSRQRSQMFGQTRKDRRRSRPRGRVCVDMRLGLACRLGATIGGACRSKVERLRIGK